MEWVVPVLSVVGTMVGSGAVTAWVQGKNEAAKRQDATADANRRDAVVILRDILATEQGHRSSCETRLATLEREHQTHREECIRRTLELETRVQAMEARLSEPAVDSSPPRD